jgi:hypothetical protein
MKLGRNPSNPKAVAKVPHIKNHLKTTHLVSPNAQNWGRTAWVNYWGMMLNDSLGDCVIAAKGHGIILYTTLVGNHHNVILTDQQILAGYEAVGGYVPGQPNTDQGCDMLTAAQYYVNVGYGGHRISTFAAVVPSDIPTLQASINLFGYVDLGINFPQSAFNQFSAGQPWDVVQGAQIVGGHDIPVVGYNRSLKMYQVVTWGRLQLMTEAFLLAYGTEAYTYLSPDWIANGRAPNKYDLWQLQQDLLAA